MSNTSAFPKILHIGDKQIADLFDGEVEITEKLDGSQFGFGLVNNELVVRSKGREIDLDNFDKMFGEGVAYVKSIMERLPNDYFFYGEYLQKPRHSTLAYDKTPKNNISLFGVYNQKTREFGNYDDISEWSKRLSVDSVPLLKRGKAAPQEILEIVENTTSYLGGQKIEGVVVKAYKPWLFLGQIPLTVMSGKYVSEAFKEVHNKDWKNLNTGKGKLEVLKDNYLSEARWNKAIQHLRDDGILTETPKDIGPLIKEVMRDIREEEELNIKEQLWNIYGKDILSFATTGLPEWYKKKIMLGDKNE